MRFFYLLCKDTFTSSFYYAILYVKISLQRSDEMGVKNKIRELREERGISQLDAAARLNVSRQTMSAIENMKYNPSLELTLKIAKLFALPVEDIFELEED